jgi:ubiquinone/menaquinone biosynthesis C-methylase UbiE
MNRNIPDSWQGSDPYERFMGRWSRVVARRFLDWLTPSEGLKWLDVGCGSGALSEAILRQCAPSELIAVDQSESFVNALQARLGVRIKCRIGDALALPCETHTVDITVSGLVINFIPDPVAALVEMRRVTKPGGMVALYAWDYPGSMDLLNRFWDCAVALDPSASNLHEAVRFSTMTAERLSGYFESAGFERTESTGLEIEMGFRDFDDYWEPFLGGQGPAPTYLMSFDETKRQTLRELLKNSLPIEADGSIRLNGRAWGVRGIAT